MSEETKSGEGHVGKRVAKATGAILVGQMASKVLGAIEKPLMAFRFGTGAAADAYGAAVGLVLNTCYIIEQLLQHAFMPTFIQTRTKQGEKEGWRLAGTIFHLVLIAFVAAGIIAFLFAPQIVAFSTDFKNPRATGITVYLLRIMVPAIVILPVSSLTYVILNSYKIFGLPAAADVVFKSGTVIALVVFAAKLGVPALAAGVVLGTIAKIAIHFLGLRTKIAYYRPKIELSNPQVQRVGVLAVPLLLGNILGNIRPLWDNWLCSGLELGAVAALRYGRAVVDTPAQVFPLALRRALFPFMAEMAARDERERMTEVVVRSLRVVAVVFVPLTVGMLLLRYPIVQVIYQWGKFGKDSTELVVPAMTFLTVGLFAMGAEMILLEPYFAMSDTLTPTKIAVATFVAHIGFTWGASHALGMGVGGVALGYTLARTLKIIILAVGLRHRLTHVPIKPLIDFTVRLGVAVAVMAGVVWVAMAQPIVPPRMLELDRTHLKDKSRFLSAVQDPTDRRAALSAYLLGQFSPETREGLAQYYAFIDPPAALKEGLAADLNRILTAGPLYDADRFEDVSLKDDMWDLINKNPTGPELVRLNRLLLEAAHSNKLPLVGMKEGLPESAFLFRPADFNHRARFVVALHKAAAPESKDRALNYVWGQLSPETQNQIGTYLLFVDNDQLEAEGREVYEPSRDLRDRVVADLNRVIEGESLYTPERFANIALTGETQKWVQRHPSGAVGVWLNRVLLEEAYLDEIAPPRKIVDLIRFAVPSAVGALAFVLLCLMLKVEEASYLFGFIAKRLGRGRKKAE